MQEYKLVIRHAADGPVETIDVQSNSAADVLALAHRHHGEYAELWREDKLLCRMTYTKGGFWTIQSQKAITAEPAATTKILAETAARQAKKRLPTHQSRRARRKPMPKT
jgi:hypothetical protein